MRRSRSKSLLITALICGTIGVIPCGGTVFAEEAGDNAALQAFDLEQIVVTAARTENKLIDTAANVAVVTAEDIEKRNYQSAADALKDVPGVVVTFSGGSREKHIVLNGDDRVVIMIDGRRLNQEKGASSGHQAYDIADLPSPDAIERIEVLKGGASALYGSDAVGGVINVITKQPEKTEIRLNAGVGSWRTENYRASVAAKVGKTGILVTAQKERQAYLKYKDANDSSTKRWDKADYSTDNVDVKLTQDIGKDQQATLYFHHSYKNGNQPIYIGSTLGPSAGSDLNNDVSLQYDWGKDTDHAGYVRLYRNYYVGNYYSDSGDNHYTETKQGIDVQQNFRLSENNKLTAGLEWRDSHIGSGLYDGRKKIVTKAIFLQDTWNFAPEWTLTLGDRYDKHNMFGHKNTLSAGLNKKFGEKGHAYLTWSQVFRAPQGNDLYWLEDWGWGMGLFGNPNLKPETGDVWTIGYSTAVNDKTQIGISAFYSKLNNAIKWKDTGGWHYEALNVDKEKKRGFELSVNHKLTDRLSVNASYAYVKSEIETDGVNGRDYKIAPNQYKFGISYQDDRFGAELMGRGASGQSSAMYADSKYLTMDLSLQYKIKNNWKVYANLYNLTNAAYTEYPNSPVDGRDRYPAAGRHFFIGTEYKF